eukprot:jgi/Bigna1/83818/fgenesh1_pg.116_\
MSKSSSAGAGSRGSGATTKIIGWRTLALLSGGYVVYKMLRESKLLECPVVIRGEDAFYLKQAGKKKEDLSADFKERECKEINFVLMDSSRARYLVRHLYMAIQELGFPSFVALIVYGGMPRDCAASDDVARDCGSVVWHPSLVKLAVYLQYLRT